MTDLISTVQREAEEKEVTEPGEEEESPDMETTPLETLKSSTNRQEPKRLKTYQNFKISLIYLIYLTLDQTFLH